MGLLHKRVDTVANMGRVRTKTVKKASRVIVEKYYSRLTLDFDTNKRIAEDVAIIPSKRLRNKIAGFTTVSISPGFFSILHGRWRLPERRRDRHGVGDRLD